MSLRNSVKRREHKERSQPCAAISRTPGRTELCTANMLSLLYCCVCAALCCRSFMYDISTMHLRGLRWGCIRCTGHQTCGRNLCTTCCCCCWRSTADNAAWTGQNDALCAGHMIRLADMNSHCSSNCVDGRVYHMHPGGRARHIMFVTWLQSGT